VYSALYLEHTIAKRPSVRRGSFLGDALSMENLSVRSQSAEPVNRR
jgi:hypothetical protein